jgi:hypothetical protein
MKRRTMWGSSVCAERPARERVKVVKTMVAHVCRPNVGRGVKVNVVGTSCGSRVTRAGARFLGPRLHISGYLSS